MSGSIGHTFLYNMIILFIVIVFAFLAGTLSYYKAFKVNNRIINSIEKFEGYNSASYVEINRNLGTIGYRTKEKECPDTYKGDKYKLVSLNEQYNYCIYIENERPDKNSYYHYGILTFMNLDVPLVNVIDIPVFTRTNQIYKFTNKDKVPTYE